MSETSSFSKIKGKLLSYEACPVREVVGLTPLYMAICEALAASNNTEIKSVTKAARVNWKKHDEMVSVDLNNIAHLLSNFGAITVTHNTTTVTATYTPKQPVRVASTRPPVQRIIPKRLVPIR